jgi:GT2 family glycosyltransferase
MNNERKSARPLVSVILPTFNRLHYLQPAVESVFAQTYDNWELIVADDGSGEETRVYLGGLADRPGVRVLWLTHSGNPGALRNAAVREARGDYIAFLDSDDVWMPSKLELQMAALRACPDRRWNYTQFIQINSAGQRINSERTARWVYYDGQVFEDVLHLKAGIPVATVVVAREFLELAGGFDERQRLREDYQLWLKLALLGEVSLVRQVLAGIRRHSEHFSTHGLPSLQAREMVLQRMASLMTNSQQRSALRAARARNFALLTVANAAASNDDATWQALASSWRCSWHYAAWWTAAAKGLAHLYLPPRLTAILREVRRRTRRTARYG